MQLFYTEIIPDTNQLVNIFGQENIHLTKVLRKNIGDVIMISNGLGKLVNAEIVNVSKKKSTLKILNVVKDKIEIVNLSIAIAPTKNISRIEWFTEKAVEIGIDEILLFVSQNSEKRKIKIERIESKALSAMKQCLKLTLPKVNELIKFKELITIKSKDFDKLFLAYCDEKNINFVNELNVDSKTLIVIGPEGGFTIEEVKLAKLNGFKIVSLGETRLRTETAGIYACSVFNSLKHLKK